MQLAWDVQVIVHEVATFAAGQLHCWDWCVGGCPSNWLGLQNCLAACAFHCWGKSHVICSFWRVLSLTFGGGLMRRACF